MAHECPECGIMCYCGGDIDDLCLNDDEDVNGCNHCLGRYDEEDDYDDFDDYDANEDHDNSCWAHDLDMEAR